MDQLRRCEMSRNLELEAFPLSQVAHSLRADAARLVAAAEALENLKMSTPLYFARGTDIFAAMIRCLESGNSWQDAMDAERADGIQGLLAHWGME